MSKLNSHTCIHTLYMLGVLLVLTRAETISLSPSLSFKDSLFQNMQSTWESAHEQKGNFGSIFSLDDFFAPQTKS